jgi:hypothetical protein
MTTYSQATPNKEILDDEIARRAHELFKRRGCEPGHDIDDWLQAERELDGPARTASEDWREDLRKPSPHDARDRSSLKSVQRGTQAGAKTPLLRHQHLPTVTADTEAVGIGRGFRATRDHEVIRRWADRRQARPATGEATRSGPATVDVKDGGTGIRFSFPGFSAFRAISWDEWFDNFARHDLVFVYEDLPADAVPSQRFRIVKATDWTAEID